MDTTEIEAPNILNFDKLVHTVMFLGLSGVIFFDSTGYLRFQASKILIFYGTFLFPVVLGGIIEILQEYLTKSRTGDWFDFLFNVFGALIGLGIAFLINSRLLIRK